MLAALLGRVGVWLNLDRFTARELRALAHGLEDAGYRALWYPETVAGREAMSLASFLLASTERLVVATGIASMWARDAMAAATGARHLAEAYPRRFVLGLGVSHRPSAEARGHDYVRPLTRMREYLDGMAAVNATLPEPPEPAPIVLAALGPAMLRLARERASGAHPYFVPLEHTRRARAELGSAPVLVVEQAVVLERDPERARRIARLHTRRYLSLENYRNNLIRLGWSEADMADGGSDALVDAVVAWGDVPRVAERVRAHLESGADHVCVQVLVEGVTDARLPAYRTLAKMLL